MMTKSIPGNDINEVRSILYDIAFYIVSFIGWLVLRKEGVWYPLPFCGPTLPQGSWLEKIESTLHCTCGCFYTLHFFEIRGWRKFIFFYIYS